MKEEIATDILVKEAHPLLNAAWNTTDEEGKGARLNKEKVKGVAARHPSVDFFLPMWIRGRRGMEVFWQELSMASFPW